MYTIDSTNKKIVFTYSKSTLFEDLKMTSALKAQQIVSKEGTDLSDMFIITDDELGYMGRWLEATLPYITSAIPQQHLTTSVDSMNIIVTAYTDTTRALSEGNIISADGMLRNLIIFGCLAEWYSTVNQLDFQQEYATKMAEHLKVFTETLFDSRKRKVGTLFSIADGTGAKSITVADQINALQTSVAAQGLTIAAHGTTIATHTTTINSQGTAISSLDSRVGEAEGDISAEVTRAQTAEQGILNTVQEWISESLAKLTVRVNGNTVLVYDPNDTNAVLSLTIPTAVSQLSDASSYSTTAQVTALIAAAITAFAGSGGTLSTILADYALKSWVTANFAPIGGGGQVITDYVDLSSNQTINGEKTFRDIAFQTNQNCSLEIPTNAPASPAANKVYLYCNPTGNYYEE
jgi:hypothetical protein